MKIAQVAPLFEAVPPKSYGGTERVVAYLCDELVELGHDVTLFASGDSKTRAKLISCRDRAIRLDDCALKSEAAAHLTMLSEVRRRAHEFDIIHFHVELLPCPLFEDIPEHTVITTHGRLDLKDLKPFYRRWPNYPLVSVSDSQRATLDFANWVATIPHGLPLDLYQPAEKAAGNYLAFLGRVAPEKQPDVAIRAAQRAKKELRVAAKVDSANAPYFRDTIEPALKGGHVKFVGELGDAEKGEFLGNAEALLLPVNWPEPFGMVLIEAMACGTPVVACNRGAIPEVIEHGVTGFVVNNEDEILEALKQVKKLDRRKIRTEFERRFSSSVMANRYLELYKALRASRPLPSTSSEAEDVAMIVDPVQSAIPASDEEKESSMPYKLFALKHRDTFAVTDSFGNIIGTGDGLFRDDTRVLSRFRLILGDQPLSLLSATITQDNVFFTAHVTNRPLPPLGGRSIPEGVIHLKRSRFLWHERLYERLQFVNYGGQQVQAPIRFQFEADFRDMFEVRGREREARGQVLRPERDDNRVILRYRGLDDQVRSSVVAFSERPNTLNNVHAEFLLSLPCNENVELYVEIGPDSGRKPETERPGRARFRKAAAEARRSMRRRGHDGGVLRSGERVFNSWLEHSRSDLALLTTNLETGPYPYAGIPWFSTPFGRDAVITAMQMLWFDPGIARGVLAYLAHNQARETSSFRDSAPGKIMHETRKGEMNILKEIPFGLYYGGVDTTPLFVMLAGAYADRTGDLGFIAEIWSALESAMAWIEKTGDANGNGFLDYASGEETGLRNQGWKDSEDSVFHADGKFPDSPIALVEVQGYKFAALTSMAVLCKHRRDRKAARHWKHKAEETRSAVERAFWMEDQCFYALALDADRTPCRIRASNAGHLLFTGLPTPERAAQVTRQLLSSVFDCGWGIRTLANDQVRYNPMSYHNGATWPHDTAICAAGIARYGNRSAAAHMVSELFDAAVYFDMRLPELFCGFQRFPGETPIAYPVACLPQAWASGSVFMALQACLGLSIDGWKKEIHIDHPELPHGINHLSIKKLTVGNSQVNLTFQRVRDRVAVFTGGDKGDEGVNVLTYI